MKGIQPHQKTLVYAIENLKPKHRIVLEFGVWRGTSIALIRKLLPPRYSVFGFDSFEGLPEDWIGTPQKKGGFTANGEVPTIEGVRFYKGWFKDTLPVFLNEKGHDGPIGLIHVDCDLYQSTHEVLYGLEKRIVKGTILVFDEWIYNSDPKCNEHEQKCFYEWANEFGRKYELITPFKDRVYEQAIVKILS
jgi:hypothetical protein